MPGKPAPKPKSPMQAALDRREKRAAEFEKRRQKRQHQRPLFAHRPEPKERPLMGRLPDELRRKKITPPR